jgi:hypothetical protein
MKVYKSKISYGLLAFVFVLFLSMIVLRLTTRNSQPEGIIVFVSILVFVYAFIFHLFLNTKYVISGEILKIRSGVIYKKDIDIEKIKSITKTKTLISSPAASFDRIELSYGTYDSVVISPEDKITFSEALTRINPSIDNQVR